MSEVRKEDLIGIAVMYYKSRCYIEAIEACKKALILEPKCITAYYGIAKSLIKINAKKEALDVYNEALKIKETKNLYLQRGNLYSLLGNSFTATDQIKMDYRACASNDYYRALALDPSDKNLRAKKLKVDKMINEYIAKNKKNHNQVYEDEQEIYIRELREEEREQLSSAFDQYWGEYYTYNNRDEYIDLSYKDFDDYDTCE